MGSFDRGPMPALKIVAYPNPILLDTSLPVVVFDGPLSQFCEDLTTTMLYHGNAIGLAAIQVGIPLRLFVINCGLELVGNDGLPKYRPVSPNHLSGPTVFVNPEVIISSKKKSTNKEGCLSLPGVSAPIERSDSVEIRAATTQGDMFVVEADGLFSRALQHELDHLDGKTFLSRMGYARREMVKKKLSKHGR